MTGSSLQPPLRVRWQIAIGLTQSNVIVADGRVLYVNDDRVKVELTALDAATGQVLWSRPAGPGHGGGWALAYEDGRVFMSRLDWSHGDEGHVTAVAAATGALLWEVRLEESYGINAPPTVDGGTLYVPAHDGSVHLHALRTSDGAPRWTSLAMLGGNDSSPTLDAGSAYTAYGGGQVYSVARDSGQFRWHYAGCCSGGGGSTAVLHAGLLFESSDGNLIHEAATGRVIGSFPGYSGTGSIPAFAGDVGLFMSGNRLVAIAPGGQQLWAYAPLDPYDSLAWTLVAGGFAYVREGDEYVTGIDLATGRPAFCAAFISPPGSGSYPDDVVGQLHAGAGMLIVPVGYGLVALESGGSSSGCPGAGGGPGSDPAGGVGGGGGPALTLRAGRTDVTAGDRVTVTGALSGVDRLGGRVVRLEADGFPFDRWRARAAGADRRRRVVQRARDGASQHAPARRARGNAARQLGRDAVRRAAGEGPADRCRRRAPTRARHGEGAARRCGAPQARLLLPRGRPREVVAARGPRALAGAARRTHRGHGRVPGRAARPPRPRARLHAGAAARRLRPPVALRRLVRPRAARARSGERGARAAAATGTC